MNKAPATDRMPTLRPKRNARRSCGWVRNRRWANGLLAGLALVGLFGRVLVPPGFMPGGENGGWIEFCPAGPYGQFLQFATEKNSLALALNLDPASSDHEHASHSPDSKAGAHHGHSEDSEFPAEHSSTPACPIGQIFSSPALADSFCLDVQHSIEPLDERPVFLATKAIVASTVQARGPPAVLIS